VDGSIQSHDVAMNETLIDATAPDRFADLTFLSESGKGQAWLGEDRVVLGYRDDLALRARAGDEEAEDEMTVLIAAERQRTIDEGVDVVLPGWLAEGRARERQRPARAA
jgi:hypothetical protein